MGNITPPPWTCFPAGTKVKMASGVEKNIEDVVVGDKVISQSEQGTRSVSTVTKLDQPVRDHMCRLTFADGDSLRLTDEHPLFTQAGWKAITPGNTLKDNPTLYVQPMVVGDTVAKADGSWARITNVACWSEKIQAYNLILGNGAHTYFADDYLAHNKNSCDPGVILGCNACTVACGGGTQQCINECGDISTRACNTQTCCEVGSPTINEVNGSTISWTPGYKGVRQLLRVGTGYDEVMSGCQGAYSPACVDHVEYPTYTAPSGSFAAQVLYYYKTTPAGTPTGCVATSSTYTDVNSCATNLDAFLAGQTTGVCYTSLAACQMYNVDSHTVASMPPGFYYWRVVNYAACGWQDDVVTSTVACPQTAPVISGVSARTITWTPGTGGTKQILYVGASGCNATDTCAVKIDNLGTSVSSYDIGDVLTYGTNYTWYVENYYSASCSSTDSISQVASGVSGRVWYDLNGDGSDITPWSLAGLTVLLDGTALSTTVSPVTGRFNILAPAGNYAGLTLSGIPASYSCSAYNPDGCPTISNVTSYSTGNDFYLTTSRVGWWQAVGGPVYAGSTAGGTTVRSTLPTAASHLILPGAGGGTVAALLRASGTTSLGTGQVSDAGWMATTKYKGKTLNYDFFATQYGITSTTPSTWGGNGMNQLASGQDYYYERPSGGSDATVGGWTVNNGDSYVVFVNGNLTITGNMSVAQGGFLALIVNGNVTVDPAVTQVDGIYLMDGSLTTSSAGAGADSQLLVNGSTIAWGGVSLGRDLGGANVSTPAEKFTYRPDLLTNMPDKMKTFAMTWEEVVPGTIGN